MGCNRPPFGRREQTAILTSGGMAGYSHITIYSDKANKFYITQKIILLTIFTERFTCMGQNLSGDVFNDNK
jgi:hypothetical protein